jgi:hypothetical protein
MKYYDSLIGGGGGGGAANSFWMSCPTLGYIDREMPNWLPIIDSDIYIYVSQRWPST